MPVCLRNGCIIQSFCLPNWRSLLKLPIPNVSEMSGNRSRGRHHGADEVGAPATALATFEITIAGGGAAFSRLQDVGIHAETHGASRFAPFESSIEKNLVQAFLLRGMLDGLRAGHHHRPDLWIHVLAFRDARRRAQVFTAW